MKLSWVYKFLGYVLTVLAFYYVYLQLSTYNLDKIFANVDFLFFIYFLLLVLAGSLLIIIPALCWKIILEFISKKSISTAQVFQIYIKTNIAKYLPGNVLHYVGRNVLGSKLGWTHRQLALSTIIETGFSIIIPSIILVLLFLLNLFRIPSSVDFTFSHSINYLLLGSGFVIIIMLIICTYLYKFKYDVFFKYKTLIYGYYYEINNIKFVIVLSKYFTICFISFFYNGIFFFLISELLHINLDWSNLITVTSVLSIAGYSGILTPGVPGGIGVKESVSVALLATYGFDKGDLMVLLIASRIIGILGEVLMFCVSFILTKKAQF